MFYVITSVRIPLSKRTEYVNLVKTFRDHLHTTYDDVEVEFLANASGAGEELHFVAKFESKAAWAKHEEASKGDQGMADHVTGLLKLFDRIEWYTNFYETIE